MPAVEKGSVVNKYEYHAGVYITAVPGIYCAKCTFFCEGGGHCALFFIFLFPHYGLTSVVLVAATDGCLLPHLVLLDVSLLLLLLLP